MTRIDADLFYDRNIVGVEGAKRHGHRGMPAGRFFRREDPDIRDHFLVRVARQPWAFAAILFGFGFFAVFVRQADLIFQIVLGAPIFEELVKFGLALLLALSVGFVLSGFRMAGWQHPAWMFLRLPIALAVGAGFGVLEHVSTYPDESTASYAWRTAFHAGATGASMVAFQAALAAIDVRTRWLALAPSILIHYLNNFGAVVLGVGGIVLPLNGVANFYSNSLVTVLVVGLVAMLAMPSRTRRALEQLASTLPVETQEVIPPSVRQTRPKFG